MSANINSNFPSIHLIPSSIQATAKQQQIQALTNQVKGNEDKIAKIDKEIIAREKIIAATEKEIIAREKIIEVTETNKGVYIEAMQNCQNIMKVCEESKEITNQMISNNEKMLSISEKMIGIYETLIARNNASKAYANKSPIVFKDIDYNPPKIDFSKYDIKPVKPQEAIKSFNQITKDYKQRSSSYIFNDWFSRLRPHSLRFFKWF